MHRPSQTIERTITTACLGPIAWAPCGVARGWVGRSLRRQLVPAVALRLELDSEIGVPCAKRVAETVRHVIGPGGPQRLVFTERPRQNAQRAS
jgi:hypothetical protein